MTIKFPQINRICRITLITLLLFSTQAFFCLSQNLYNLENSQRYAEYLFSSRQYKLAAEEYERLVYFDLSDLNLKYKLVKSYRLSGDINLGIDRLYSFYGDSIYAMPQSLATEFIKMQILTDSFSVVKKFIQHNSTLSLENKAIFKCCNLLLNGEYKEAKSCVLMTPGSELIFPSNLIIITEKANKTRFKSPFIAASLSAIIPGTGKFYTRNWTDGIFSMVFIAGSAWQAYRGFNEHGIKSGYGWVFAGLSASFYIGNIFGSAKAAKRFNKVKKNEIDSQVYEIVRSDSF